MADVLVAGSGLIGMATAMLLAKDGHRVTVLERDPAEPAGDADDLFQGWQRRGVAQFQQAHFFQPRMRSELERELPEVLEHAVALGARRFNFPLLTAYLNGIERREGDEELDSITARRPVMEAAFAFAAAGSDGVTIRRGVPISGLVVGDDVVHGVPNVVGVRTEDGEELRADLVIDATGRRSPLPRWLDDIGAKPPAERMEDIGFSYFGRHFRGDHLPELRTGLLTAYATNSILTLPCDNDTWVVGFVTLGNDAPMRKMLDPDTWMRVLGAYPEVAHWTDAEPIGDKVSTMSKMEDRERRYVVDGEPVATGVLAVGDSWACSNPSFGRGSTIGLMHAVALRDAVRRAGTADLWSLALAFEDTTAEGPRPWLEATLEMDLGRKAEIDAAMAGEEVELDPSQEMAKAFTAVALRDPELVRGFSEIGGMLAPPDQVVSRPGMFERILELGADWRSMRPKGPDRGDLLGLLGAKGDA
jgi:2-polyprenyl-6-methoxyphenol hydroxylase-like FAD-dependent oxidoreductase